MIECRLLKFKEQNGQMVAVEPGLLRLTEEFWAKEWPGKDMVPFSKLTLTWVVVESDADGVAKVIGVTSIAYLVDVPCFHSRSSRAFALMFSRLRQWCLDMGVPDISVYAQKHSHAIMQSMMDRCKAEDAERLMFHVEPDIPVGD